MGGPNNNEGRVRAFTAGLLARGAECSGSVGPIPRPTRQALRPVAGGNVQGSPLDCLERTTRWFSSAPGHPKTKKAPLRGAFCVWWPGAESNHRHADFQSAALPTELPGHLSCLTETAVRPLSEVRDYSTAKRDRRTSAFGPSAGPAMGQRPMAFRRHKQSAGTACVRLHLTEPARLAMCLRLNAASIAIPLGAEAGHMAPSGRHVPAEGLRHCPQRGLQDRPGWRAFIAARLGEGHLTLRR